MISWREKIAPIVALLAHELSDWPTSSVRKILDYQFDRELGAHMREAWPYKIWLQEVEKHLGKRPQYQKTADDLPLFKDVEHVQGSRTQDG